MMKYLFTVLTALFIVQNVSAGMQNGTSYFSSKKELTKQKINSSSIKSGKSEYRKRLGTGIITGISITAIKEKNVSVSYPYSAYSYFDHSYHSYYAQQFAYMNASSSTTQYLLGYGMDFALENHLYIESEAEVIAPLSGHDITAINVGGGFSSRSDQRHLELRLGMNFFYLSRKARLGQIDNTGKDVTVVNSTFYRQYYKERKKDSVVVYDLYDATHINVDHNEYYLGVQPKFMVDFEDSNSPAFVRLHVGWNLPFYNDTSIDFEQKGRRFTTVTQKPTQYSTQSSLSLDTNNPVIHYETDRIEPSFTTGLFIKLEVGLKIFDNE